MPEPALATDDPEELRARLALLRVPGVGPIAFRNLIEAAGSARAALAAPNLEVVLPTPTRAALRKADWSGADRDLEWLALTGHQLLQLGDSAYPPLLATFPGAPPMLFLQGDAQLLSASQIALVGSRNPTPGGRSAAREFAAEFCRQGFAVTSGLAIGIDAASHLGALDAGGATVAVMGTGPDRIYPASHLQLAHRIADQGALVTEFPVGTMALPGNFPRRNRIIAGLSLGTLVVEAAQRSGSLLTARFAAEQGREVFAIPGSIQNPMARGCHALIRQGAKLVENAKDVVEELGPVSVALVESLTPAVAGAPSEQSLDRHYRQLLELMGFDPVSVDSLVADSELTPAEVSSMLLILELQGRVAAASGGRYVRIGSESSR
jgi:DNA processing protein